MNPPDALHVSSITASTKDQCNTRVRVDVLRRDEGSGGVVDERVKLCGHILGAQTKDAVRAPFEVCAVLACRINKGDVEGAATARDPSFGERMRVTRGTVGEAIVNHQSTIQRVGHQ